MSNLQIRHGLMVLLASVLVAAWSIAGLAQGKQQKGAQSSGDEIARGKYIVEGVARCGQCHTPRNDSGAPLQSHELEGASLWLIPAKPTQDWPTQAPRIAGNPPGTDDDMIRLLTTGVWKDGERLRQPMPQFRMSREDAQAVLAYLKSLNPGPQ